MSIFRNCLMLLLLGLLAACGGGGSAEGESGGVPAQAPVLNAQPASRSATVGDTVTFSVVASGSNLAYLWQRSTDGAQTWNDIPLATTATYSITAVVVSMSGHQFRVIVKAGSAEVTSAAATLSVSTPAAPTIAVQPSSKVVAAGSSALFEVTATGTGISYQWQGRSNAGASWLDIVPNSATAALTLNGLTTADSGRQFRVVISNAGGSVTSEVATLTVNPVAIAPSLGSQPRDIAVVPGQVASFSLSVAGGVPAPTVQWQSSGNAGVTWDAIPGATDTSYTTAAAVIADNGKRFRAVLSNVAGTTISATAVLTVGSPQAPNISATSSDQVAYWTPNDFAPKTATFGVAASGLPSPTFQWQVSTDGGVTFANVAGATAGSYTTPAVLSADNGKLFRAVVANPSGTVTSNSLRLYVLNAGFGGRPSGMAVSAAGQVFVATYPSYIFFTDQNGFMGVRRWVSTAGVSTVAGGFTVRDTGPDIDGTGPIARFQRPQGLAIDAAGNVFVADWGNRIRKITPAGLVTTLAGGNPAGGLINGTGTLASFAAPTGIAIDASGNLFVADNGNSAIRKVTPSGLVTTVASGAGFLDLDSIAIDAAGTLYATDFSLCRLWKITQSGVVTALNSAAGCVGSADGPLSSATFARTEGITVDPAGNIFVADFDRVRKITAAGMVSTLSARFAAGLQIGRGIATDAAGNLYVSDVQVGLLGASSADPRSNAFLVRRISPSGAETTFP